MKKTIIWIVALALALSLVALPATAGVYTSRIPSITYPQSNLYGLGVKDPSSRITFLTAVQSFNTQPISPSGFTGAGMNFPIYTPTWNSRLGGF